MKLIIALIGALLFLVGTFIGFYVWHWEHRAQVLEVYCFALDKTGASPGNLALFIRTPNGHTILIDGGKSSSIINDLTSVMPFYRRTINTVISTSPDDNHITGLVGVLDRFSIGRVIEQVPSEAFSLGISTSSAYSFFQDKIVKEKIKDEYVEAGDVIDFGDPRLSVRVFFPSIQASSTESDQTPSASSSGFIFSKSNPPALSFSIEYAHTVIWFGGDITKKEQFFISQKMALSSDSDGKRQDTVLILPRAENVAMADNNFFTILQPQNIVVLRKANLIRTSSASQNPKKSPKKVKTSFSIDTLPNLLITNLASEGDVEFVSNGDRLTKINLAQKNSPFFGIF